MPRVPLYVLNKTSRLTSKKPFLACISNHQTARELNSKIPTTRIPTPEKVSSTKLGAEAILSRKDIFG